MATSRRFRPLTVGLPLVLLYCALSIFRPSLQLQQYLDFNRDSYVLPSSAVFNETLSTVATLWSDMTTSFQQQTTSTVEIEKDKPHLIIHIGPPKTGTTTIQEALLGMTKAVEQDLSLIHI